MSVKTKLEESIEILAGEAIEVIRSTPLDVWRKRQEAKLGHRLKFPSMFPTVGRGNVLHKGVLSQEQINEMSDEALTK
jgi:hypothetical protein